MLVMWGSFSVSHSQLPRVPICWRHGVDLELTKNPHLTKTHTTTPPPKWSRIAIALTPTIFLLAINVRPTNLHRKYGYSTLYISLATITTTSITLAIAWPSRGPSLPYVYATTS